jgi:TetR/AcrR family transcriptional regulator, cholesterol catabolism regulator
VACQPTQSNASSQRQRQVPRNGAPTRDRILSEVTKLFVSNGYHGTGIREISDAVGLGRGALYHHISSKNELLFEISLALLNEAMETSRPIAESAEPPDVRLRGLARALLQHRANHGDGWSVVLREARFLSDVQRNEINRARDDFESLWARTLADGAASGIWRPVDAIDVRGILGMFNSAARWMRPDGPMTPDAIADRYIDLITHGIAPQAN